MGRLFDFMLPDAKSPTAEATDALFHFINEVSLIFLVGITFAIIYFAIKYRRKSDEDKTPVITHNNALEITWSVIPLILVMIVFAWGYSGWMTLKTVPDDAYEVQVTGFKWGWTFNYSNGAVSSNELHVPVDRPIKLVMQSRDVLHSFYVPDYRIKQDLMPNRYTYTWFKAEEVGESIVFCTEYCGTSHSNMLATVVVHEQEDFDTWLITNQSDGSDMEPAEYGENLIAQQGCASCHSVDGSQMIGPSFQGLWGKEGQLADGSSYEADENYIKESILYPQEKIVAGYENQRMTAYLNILDDDQISAIIEYLKTLD